MDENTPPMQQDAQEELAMCLVIGGSKVSLQDSFKRFRVQKVKERKILQRCRDEISSNGPRTEEYKSQLRQKFIDQSKKYIGVPYAERFKAPEAPVAPLYLDCCALVRKCVQDLQEEFGFVIGKWNQCYQMDTLPVVLEQSQLKPGDLIFYEGVYNSSRSKPQKHNNVHVEIFLGGETGEATIGSRYHKGNVNIFPSFKFKSTTWDLVQYHFRSLDPWLEGACKSCCPEHPWLSDTLAIAAAAGKRSIFNDLSDDESAGGCDDDDDDEIQGGGDEEGVVSAATAAAAAGEGLPEPARLLTPRLAALDVTVEAPPVPPNGGFQDGALVAALDATASASESAAGVATTPTRGPSPIPSASPAKSATSQQQQRGTPSRSGQPPASGRANVGKPGPMPTLSKASPSRGEVGAVGGGRQAVRRSSEGLTETAGGKSGVSGGASLSSSSSRRAPRVSSSVDSLDAESKLDGSSHPHTYYVCNTNGWKLVKTALDKRGWQQLPFEYQFSTRFGLKWVERRSQIDYRSHVPGQLVCHIPNNEVITTKVGLLQALRDTFCKVAAGAPRKRTPWLPETYSLDSPTDITALMQANQAKIKSADGGKEPLWIYKPSSNNRGRGIRVVAGVETLNEICYGKDTGSPESSIPKSTGIVQSYIERPLLVPKDGSGFKFDYRCYMLVSRNHPSYLAFFHPGYCRLTLKPYTDSVESLADSTVHLTNAAVQKKDPLYEANKDFQIQSVESVAALIEQTGDAQGAAFLRNDLDTHVKCCMVDVLRAATPKFLRKCVCSHLFFLISFSLGSPRTHSLPPHPPAILHREGFFDLFGLDFMVTAERKLYLLEVNTNPALSLDNAVLEELLPVVVDGALDLVLSSQGPDRPSTATDDALLANLPGRWELLYDEAGKYEFSVASSADTKGEPSKT